MQQFWDCQDLKRLNGVEEGEDGMQDEDGDATEGEGEMTPPRGKSTKPHLCHSGRTHHHVTKHKSEGTSRRPTLAMDHDMKMWSVVNA